LVESKLDPISTIARYHKVQPEKLRRSYKKKLSNFKQWQQKPHCKEYLIYPENITQQLAIDEVSLSKGELYTFITSKKYKTNQRKLVAVINGTEAKTMIDVVNKISEIKRNTVKEVSMDMARNMELTIKTCFPNATRVTDRFHVSKLVIEALQHLRVKFRWQAIDEENQAIKTAKEKKEKYRPTLLQNGDTLKELLARTRYLLYKTPNDWTLKQTTRAGLLFKQYPVLEQSYKLTLEFRSIYECTTKSIASTRMTQWIEKVKASKISEFNTVANSIYYHWDNILNFFDHRSTNAHAESYNAKLKLFRANLRGVKDVKFFLFRLEKLFA
jgi:transposase